MIVINDVLTTLGTIFKMSIEFNMFDSYLFTAAGILMGVGVLLVWCGILRYLGLFSQYNVIFFVFFCFFFNSRKRKVSKIFLLEILLL